MTDNELTFLAAFGFTILGFFVGHFTGLAVRRRGTFTSIYNARQIVLLMLRYLLYAEQCCSFAVSPDHKSRINEWLKITEIYENGHD